MWMAEIGFHTIPLPGTGVLFYKMLPWPGADLYSDGTCFSDSIKIKVICTKAGYGPFTCFQYGF